LTLLQMVEERWQAAEFPPSRREVPYSSETLLECQRRRIPRRRTNLRLVLIERLHSTQTCVD
jgi:hypothetical protein